MLPYAVTIFLSAFLIFQVQPLLGRYILPWFGGTPAVWSTCMLFFQMALLGGYLYAHLISGRLSHRGQRRLHLTLLTVSLLFLPIGPSADYWRPEPGDSPVAGILLLLLATVGLPFMLLASTGPLLQRWFADEFPERSPYRLYALSNLASVLGLVTYPFIMEPLLRLQMQAWFWSAFYVLFGVAAAACAWRGFRLIRGGGTLPVAVAEAKEPAQPPSFGRQLLWIALAAVGSAHLLAATNQLCQDVASVPFLWVLLLVIYLLSFIVCFERERWYHRGIAFDKLAVAVALAIYLLYVRAESKLWAQIAGYTFILWAAVYICHGELYRARPNPRFLTRFYLCLSFGGAAGGFFVAIVAPRIFPGYWEYTLTLDAVVGLALFLWVRTARRAALHPVRRAMVTVSLMAIWFAVAAVLGYLSDMINLSPRMASQFRYPPSLYGYTSSARNFYGVLRTRVDESPIGPIKTMVHGNINHGFQAQEADKRRWPISYFSPESGIGLAMTRHPKRVSADAGELDVGIIGLGVGTLLAYGQSGDRFSLYEINPLVIELAEKEFTYLADSPAVYEHILGDGRISLDRERPEKLFDILVIDAFSSDAIPVHLLTLEAGRLYKSRLKAEGLLVFNVVNRHVDIVPVVRGLAGELDLEPVTIFSEEDMSIGALYAEWMILTDNRDFIEDLEVRAASYDMSRFTGPAMVWTDDFSSLWPLLRIR